MLISQVSFRLKFGMAREAMSIWQKIMEEMKSSAGGQNRPFRMMTDLSGRAYTLTIEIGVKNFNDMNPMQYYWSINPRIPDLYKEFVLLCDSASQELYRIEFEC